MKKVFIVLAVILLNISVAQGTQRIPEDGGDTSSLKNVVVFAPVAGGWFPSVNARNITGPESGTHFYLKNPNNSMANFSLYLPSDAVEGSWYKFSALYDDGKPQSIQTSATGTIWYIKSLHHEIITNVRDMNTVAYAVNAPEPVYRGVKWRNYKAGDSAEFTFADGNWRVRAQTGPGAMSNEIVTRHTP